jgi:single-stranded DNA-specific DHH superfamily exonuclease
MPRAVRSEAELDKSLARLIPYQQLKGIEAVDLLVTALEQRQRILIVGDFDADGATASTVGTWACACWVRPMSITWCPTASNTATA